MIRFTKDGGIGFNAPIGQDSRLLVDTAAKEAPFGKVVVKNGLLLGTEVFTDPLIVKVFYILMDIAVQWGDCNHPVLCWVMNSIGGERLQKLF